MLSLESVVQFLKNNNLVALFTLLLFSWSLFFICKIYLIRLVRILTSRISSMWGRVLFAPKLLSQLSWFLPVIVLHSGSKLIDGLPKSIEIILERGTLVAIVILSIRTISLLLWQFNEIYSELELSRNRPIKGIIQVFIIILYGIGLILTIATLLNRSPWFFLSGLGAMTAVLLLVFRDTILSLVAGVQLTTNGLVRVGDWIEMPQFNADGDVVDIALHSVKVQNWDKTITIIPTHKFLENSFKNWRGMEESGGRRVKRSILIDISTIRFLTEEEINRFRNFSLLKSYIDQKVTELNEYNAQFSPELQVNARRLTNVGTFRAYIGNYLKQHPKVNPKMTFLIRQLEPTEHGLPIEIYIFINDVRWAHYEAAQADIFDHLLATISEFGLRIHQTPTGHDVLSSSRPILQSLSTNR
ncbi:MAG: mechanosensitive ion channel family protein [Bacteriovoracia bacterium]